MAFDRRTRPVEVATAATTAGLLVQRRITAVVRRANGRFAVYTGPDTFDVTRETSQPDSLKQSSQSFIDIPLGSANPMS